MKEGHHCIILAVLLVKLILKTDCQCTHGDVRLVSGAGDYEGNVQVCINSTWGYVCDDSWSSNEAEVTCTQLGYSPSNALHWFSSRFGVGDIDTSIWLSKVQCNGSEGKLIDCPKGVAAGEAICDYNQLAGVVCQKGNPGCSAGDIQLVNSYATNNNYYGRSEGRVEVCHNNTWGTVCNDGWGIAEANVACKQLGYTAYVNYYTYASYYGAGTGPIWLDDLYYCSGNEDSLFDCTNDPIGSHNCDHDDDVGVRCYANDISTCTNGDIKLWSAYNTTAVNEGMVLVCKSGTWYPLHDSSNCRAVEIVCNATGYSDVQYIRSNTGKYYGYYYATHYGYTCSKEDHLLLSDCQETSYSNSHYTSSLGVVCTNKIAVVPTCTNGDIQLVNGGSETEGRVEYCSNGQWVPFCALGLVTADLICKQLGYSKGSGSEIIRDNQYGISDTISTFQYLSCPTFSNDLSQCSVSETCVPTSCDVQFGLRCNVSCLHGDVRLIGGVNTNEGNVQVCVNGTWGYICDNSWSNNDAVVVCRQLGYSVSFATSRQNSYYGYGTGTIWFDDVTCTGSETQLIDCPTGEIDSNCKLDQMAGVSCPFGGVTNCTDGDIRLINFYTSSYGQSIGRLEYCHNSEWGTVCDNNWQNVDSEVACRQLGYNGYAGYSTNAYYGAGVGSIWLDNVQCSGDESSLESCQFDTNTDNTCIHSDDVGIACYSTNTSPCNDGDVSLWSAYGHTPDNEGTVLICKNGAWYAVYGSSNCFLADMLCKEAGYSTYEFYRGSSGYYYGNYDSHTYQYTCSENAVKLSECIEKKNTYRTYYTLSLRCQHTSDLNCSVEGAVRLVGGDSEAEGRVEYCYNGEWAPMCSLNSYTGSLMCSKLGYAIQGSQIISDERYGRMYGHSKLQSLTCTQYSDTSLSDCSTNEFQSSCSNCYTQYGLKCFGEKAACVDGSIRLWSVHESTPDNEGIILVCKNGDWYPMYGSSDCRSSEIVCDTLGYSDVEFIQYNGQSFYGNLYQKRYRYTCSDGHTSLSECSQNEYSISPSYLRGVKCHVRLGSNCSNNGTNGDIQLVDGGAAGEGRVEYCFHGEWAPMCSMPGYTSTMICQELGYNQGSLVISDQRYGKSNVTGSIFNYLSCSIGSDFDVSDCSVNTYRCSSGPPSCSTHYGIKCYGNQTSCTDGDVTLWSTDDSTPDNKGLIIVCSNGKWYPVYGFSNCRVAELACHDAGYLSLEDYTYQGSSSYGSYYQTHLYYSCQSTDHTVSECSYSTTTSWYYSLGVQCSLEPIECTNEDVRLVGGDSEAEGRVEYCYNGQWSPMCSLNDYVGSLVCKELGYTQGSYVISDERYGRLNVSRRFQYISCSTYSQFTLSDCSSINRRSCSQSPASCSIQYGLKCFGDKLPCSNGSVTLWSHHDSTPTNQGIPLVCKNGVWYPIYDNSNCRAAEIICNTAGYQELQVYDTSVSYSTYGYYYEFHYGYSCQNSDSSLDTCTESYHDLYYSFSNSLGVTCQNNSGLSCNVEGAVRLVGGDSEAEGRVEYCYNGQWAPMCSLSGYTGSLICSEMGYEEASIIVSDERYGRLSGYSKFQSLSCSIGSDTSLSQCSVSERSCSQGATTCSTQYGLKCLGTKTTCNHGDIKLWSAYNTTPDNEGLVLVCRYGDWYPAHELSGCRAAEIACNEAGYSTLDYYASDGGNTYGYYYKSHYRYSCSDNDINLSDCSRTYYSLSSSWDDSLSIRCELGPLNCTNGDIRLVNGTTDAEGRVEYCYNGEWSSMCSLDGYTGSLICKELGYTQGGLPITDERYGRLDVSAKFQSLSCLYSHNAISQCSVAKRTCFQGPLSCSIQSGLKCFGGKSSCTDGDVTIWSAHESVPDNEGIILVCKNSTWYPVYDTSDCRAGELACKAAGYPNMESYTVVGGSIYGNFYETAYQYTCSENSQSLFDCKEVPYLLSDNTGSWYRSLGVKCQPSSDETCNLEGAVRLVGGNSEAEGRVEYCYNGEWSPMCSVNGYTGSLICQYLGYSKWSVSDGGEMFNRTNVKSKFQYLSCSSSHTNISECSVIDRTCTTGSCTIQYGLRCYNPSSDCTDGDVRLVDGVIEQEGRPEVCINRVWGSICDSGWSLNDGYVMCLSLGYMGSADPTTHYNSKFGLGSVPVVWSNVNCNHWNTDIHDCSRIDYPGFICTTSDVAGIRCTEGCSDGEVRLVGGSHSNEGTVEVCYDELWGLVSDNGWSDSSTIAMVVCRQLGVTDVSSAIPVTGSYYGKPNKTIHLTSVQCTGDESMLSQCSYTELSLEDGVQLVHSNVSVAGVKCIETSNYNTQPSSMVTTTASTFITASSTVRGVTNVSISGSNSETVDPSRSDDRGGITAGSSSSGDNNPQTTVRADSSTGTNSTTIMIGGVVIVVIVLLINLIFFAVVIVIVRRRIKHRYNITSPRDSRSDAYVKRNVAYDGEKDHAEGLYSDIHVSASTGIPAIPNPAYETPVILHRGVMVGTLKN